MKSLLLFIYILLTTSQSEAFEVTPIKSPSGLGVTIQSIAYSEKIKNELSSGFSTKILYVFQLKEGQKTTQNLMAQYSVRYDLWDETFNIEISLPSGETHKQQVQAKNEVLARLKSPSFPGLFGQNITPRQAMAIHVNILLNPVKKEKMEQIRKWVSQNSTSNPFDPAGGRSQTSTGARGETVFNTIFRQFSQGSTVAGIWTTSGKSKPFRWDEVPIEE